MEKLAVIDFHSGLGKVAFGEPIYVGPTNDGFELAKMWFGEEVKNLRRNTAVATPLTGSVADALPPPNNSQQMVFLALEFGTLQAQEVLNALRAVHWLYAIPDRVTPLRGQIKREIRDAFYVDAPWWKAAVYGRAADFAIRASRALHNTAS